MRTRGFTLLEVLGIVPIVVVLVGIGQGLALKPGDKANEVTCLNNEQRLGMAFQMYRQDNNDTLPWWVQPGLVPVNPPINEPGASWTWDVAISPYVADVNIFHCPTVANHMPDPRFPVRTYSFPRNVSGMPYAAAPLPEKTVLLFEKGTQLVGVGADSTGEWFSQTVAGASSPLFQFPTHPEKWGQRHDAGNNFLFMDEHTSWEKEQIFTSPSFDNPYGHSWDPRSPAKGIFQYGYCGSKTSVGSTGPLVNDWGANLPH